MAPSTGASADVLIAGAGPAGSATAALLARAGLRVIVAERAAFPREKPCSEFMSPEAVRLLDRLGVLAEVDPEGAPIEGLRVTAARGARLEGIFARAGHTPFRAAGLSLSRSVLDAALADVARRSGAALLERATVQELVRGPAGVAGAVLRDAAGTRRVIRARLTVGADGLRSRVSRWLGRRHSGHLRRVAFVAHVAGVRDLGRCAEMFVGETGYAGINPIGGGVASLALVVPQGAAAGARGDAETWFFDALERIPGMRGRIDRRALLGRVQATGPFAARSGAVVADGAALVGDAAEFFDPFTGDGIWSALRGAELLAAVVPRALERPGPVTASRLARYRRARRRAFAGKWAVERVIGYGMQLPALFDRAVARLAMRPGMADRLVGVTGAFVPARAVLNPAFLARLAL